MAKREGIGIFELMRQLDAGIVAPVYLIVGEESFFRDRAVAAIRRAVIGPEAAHEVGFNDDLLYGDETDALEVLNVCDTLPVLAERRLVIVRDIGALKARETERLLPYVKTPVETTCLVLTGEKVDGRLKFFQAVKAVAVTVDCGPSDPRAIPALIESETKALGLQLDDRASEALQQASGGSMAVVLKELEKVAAYIMPSTDVTVDDVEAVRGADTGGTVWDLLEALGRKDREGALRALRKVMDAGEPPLRLMGLLAFHYRQIWKTRELLARHVPEAGLARMLGVPPYRVRGLVEQARRFSEEDLAAAFEAFRETDSRLKGWGRGAASLIMERLALNLCRGGARPTSPRAFAPAR